MTTSTGDVYVELERLRRVINAIDDFCSGVLTGYPSNGERDFVAKVVLDIIEEAR